MAKRWSTWRVLWVVVLAVGLLLAVGGPAQGAAKTTSLSDLLNPEAADPRSKALKAAIDGFIGKNADIEVKTESIHWGKIDGLAIQAAAAGGGPDVLNVYSVQLTKHVNAKTVTSLNAYVEKWYSQNKNDYIIPPKETTYNGKVYAPIVETRVWVLYYQQELLEKAGLKVPQTLNELAKAAQKIGSDRLPGVRHGPVGYAIGGRLR